MRKLTKIVFLFLFLVIFLNLFSPKVRNFFFLLFSPLQKPLWQASNQLLKFFSDFSQFKSQRERLEFLEKENLRLLQENLSLKELKKENEFLKKSLGFKEKENLQFLFAQVFQKDFFSDTILIDKGKKDGVDENFFVFLPEKVLVGKVSQAFDNFSRVQLVSSKNFEVDVKIAEKEIFGKLVGKGNSTAIVQFLERKEEVLPQDKIVSAGFSKYFPENFLIGEIEEKHQKEITPYLEAKVRVFFSLKDLDYVLLAKK